MFFTDFYNASIRKYVTVFGGLFDDIYITRELSDGTDAQTFKVPVSYGPREKFLARVESDPDLYRGYSALLPRIGFEIIKMTYATDRKLSSIQTYAGTSTASNGYNKVYVPVPYDLTIRLSVMVKQAEDGAKIVEQILPFFNPDYNLTLNTIPALGIKNDLPIILNSVSYDDNYEGDFSSRRAIIWTLNFTLKLNFYGPVNRQGIIRRTNIDMFNNPELTQRIQTYNAEVDPNTAVPGDDIGVIESFEDF